MSLPVTEAPPTLTARVLACLDEDEGTTNFSIRLQTGYSVWQVGAALQRLKRDGLASSERCPDGEWVWFRV